MKKNTMKKLSFILISIAFVIVILVGQAYAVSDIRGEYSGTYTIVVSNCQDSSSNGTYSADLSLIIPTQTVSSFSGSAEGTFNLGGTTATEYIKLDGTIDKSGQISGTTTHTFLGTAGEGTFTGQLAGDELSIVHSGQDTVGGTCTYVRDMQATRTAPILINQYKLTPHVDSDWLKFGYNVSISGDKAIVGCQPLSDNNIAPAGAVWFFERNGSIWEQEAFIKADTASAEFGGRALSISGNYAIVGAKYDRVGHGAVWGIAYVFERKSSGWVKVADLKPPEDAATQSFGSSGSVFGRYAFVGDIGDDDFGRYSGAVYIFERGTNGWTQVDKLTADDAVEMGRFGGGISISGDYAIVTGVDVATNTTSYYIFKNSGSQWIQKSKINLGVGVISGQASISADGDMLLIGAPHDYDLGEGVGAVYVLKRDVSNWMQKDKLYPIEQIRNGYFGYGVSISGNIAIAGGISAYIIKRNNNQWEHVAKLPQESWIVSISGKYAIVGNSNDDEKGLYSGAAYIYDLSTLLSTAIPWVPILLFDD